MATARTKRRHKILDPLAAFAPKLALTIHVPDLCPPIRLEAGRQPVYMKEVIYDGDFVKDEGKPTEMRFSVTPALRSHWLDQFNRMSSAGVQVPMPVEHTRDPEKRRATVIGMELGTDSKGRGALFCVSRFNDTESAKLANSADVSLYSPPSQQDGKGRSYTRPIQHIAFTDYPVIPDLDPWKAVAASLVGTIEPEDDMKSLLALAQALEVDITGMSEDAAVKALALAFKKAPVTAPGTIELSQLPEGARTMMTRTCAQNRALVLSNLVRTNHITKACHDALVDQYCSDDEIALSLSDSARADTFDLLVESLSLNQCHSEGNVAQVRDDGTIALSGAGGAVNPLIADAQTRAKAAAAK